MSSNILDARNGIVTAMLAQKGTGERFEGLSVSAHGGDFNTEIELLTYAKHLPAAIVTVQQVKPSPQETDEPYADVTFGIFLLTGDKPGLRRADGALMLVENVSEFIARFPTNSWSAEAGPISNMIARNYYSQKFDSKNVALWGLFWTQRVQIRPGVPYVFDALQTIAVDYDLAPRDNDAILGEVIDAQDLIDFTGDIAFPVTWATLPVTWAGRAVTW